MTTDDGTMRLNKYLAFHLGVSRRRADEIIASKHVEVNGTPAELGSRVETGERVTINGNPVQPRASFTYLVLHKPAGYVCSRRRQGETPTIYELLPQKYHHLKPVGRLDADSSGLLLLTDDGDFAFSMTHPKFYKLKQYDVTLDRDLAPLHQQMINDFGIQLDDGPSKLTLEKQRDDSRTAWHVQMSEGRNRQIRRTFAALGYTVTGLHRTEFGGYQLAALAPGNYEITTRTA